MKYRKLKADFLFAGSKMLNGSNILIVDGSGVIKDIVTLPDAGEDVETFKGILCPGFINAHCHLELSHLKNVIPEKMGLVDFVYKIVSERHYDADVINDAMKQCEKEMWRNGIVAVGDICNNDLSVPVKTNSALTFYNFVEVSGWNPTVAEVRFAKSKTFYNEFVNANLKTALVPHAPYSISEELWGKIFPFFTHNVVTIHNQETKDEDVFFESGKGSLSYMYTLMRIDNSFFKPPGKRSVASYFHYFNKAASVILVHNTFTQQQDIDFINKKKSPGQLISFCLCPNANLYIENSLPDVNLFLKNNCHIIVGTDSLASNHQLSILEELKTLSKNFPGISIEQLLQWVTINGATALQMDDQLGSFETGKKPGVVLIKNVSDKNTLTTGSVAERIL